MKNKEEQFLIRLTVEEKAKLKGMAQRENTTMADLIKGRVFGLDASGAQKDLSKELKGINEKLFLLLQNTKDGNDKQGQIIELLSLLSSEGDVELLGNENTIFDYLIKVIKESYLDNYENEIDGMSPVYPDYDKYNFAREQFQNLTSALKEMKERSYPNA